VREREREVNKSKDKNANDGALGGEGKKLIKQVFHSDVCVCVCVAFHLAPSSRCACESFVFYDGKIYIQPVESEREREKKRIK
jgi:hypothetical protein